MKSEKELDDWVRSVMTISGRLKPSAFIPANQVRGEERTKDDILIEKN